MSAASPRRLGFRLALGAVIASYLALVLPTLDRLGIEWDEQTDIAVARAYVSEPGGWLIGLDADAINVRLPMASSAMIFAVLGEPSLRAARLFSVVLGVFTLVAVATFGRRELDHRKGLLAAAVLATSPYFLAYTKLAFSAGDAFVTCGLGWLLVCLARLRRRRNVGWCALTGVALGAALASKISATAAIPVVMITLLLPAKDEPKPAVGPPLRRRNTLTALLVAGFFAVAAGWQLGSSVGGGDYREAGLLFLVLHAAAVAVLWLGVLAVAWAERRAPLDRWHQCLFVLALAGLTFFVLPPVHTTNPDIFRELVGVFFFGNFESPLSFALEAAFQNAAVIALKPSPVIGLGCWLAVGVAAFRVRARPELRLPLVFVVCYLLFVIRLPWAQTFYMLPAFPAMAILLADFSVELFDRRRAAALGLAAVAAAVLASDLWRSYPDPHLNGYQWLGARPFGGRPSIGPRSLVQLPTDGVSQALRWLDDRAGPGDTVVLFVRPLHIASAILEDAPYRLVNGIASPTAIERADWVVTTLASEIRPGFGTDDPAEVFAVPYDAERLRAGFSRVYGVERAFDLEVAAVWRRNPPTIP